MMEAFAISSALKELQGGSTVFIAQISMRNFRPPIYRLEVWLKDCLAAGVVWATDLKERAFQFGMATLRLHPRIAKLGPPFAHIALQLVRSGSSIGAQLEEGEVAASRRDKGLKHAVGLREARESRYWLRMLIASNVMVDELNPLYRESGEFVAMLTTSVKKLRGPGQG